MDQLSTNFEEMQKELFEDAKDVLYDVLSPTVYCLSKFNYLSLTDPSILPPLCTYLSFSHFYTHLIDKTYNRYGIIEHKIFPLINIKNSAINHFNKKFGTSISFKNKIIHLINTSNTMFNVVGDNEYKRLYPRQTESVFESSFITAENDSDDIDGSGIRGTDLFNNNEKLDEYITINKEVLFAVRKYEMLTQSQQLNESVENVPIYFVLKTNDSNPVGHGTLMVFYNGIFYSFGTGGS